MKPSKEVRVKINHKLLCLFEGKCWHEWKEIYLTNNHTISSSPTFECRYCGEYFTDNPDFSQPAQWHEFFVWLCGKYENLWGEFYEYAHFNFCIDKSREQYDAWLFSDLARFRDLFADFLCLPETIERWGWEECINGMYNGCQDLCDGEPCGNTGKILAPWARYASEKPVQISDKKEAEDGQK